MTDFFNTTIRLPLSRKNVPLKYALVHASYWIMVTAFFIYEKKYMIVKAGLPSFITCVCLRIGLLIIVAYLNLHYLLPKYLIKGKYLKYFAGVLLSITGYLILQSLFDIFLYGYVLGPMRRDRFWETISYNFFSTLWYIGIMVALKLSIDWYEQTRLLQKTKVEKLQAEVNFLRAQVNPHFLFNVLNNLYALTLKKSDSAPDTVLKLSDMMEYMLYDSDDAQVLLEKEIKYLQNYIALEKLRYRENESIIFEVNGDTNSHVIAPLLLLPLVENAFKHGVSKMTGKTSMKIRIDIRETGICFFIENDKPVSAANPSNIAKGGIGIANLQQRLDLLYPGKYVFEIKEDADKFSASLQLNF